VSARIRGNPNGAGSSEVRTTLCLVVKRKIVPKAWVLYWKHQVHQSLLVALDYEVVAVLPSSWQEARVCEVLERLYVERMSTADEMLIYRKSHSGPYKPHNPVALHGVPVSGLSYLIGHNPVLNARLVSHLRANGDDELEWVEFGPTHWPHLCEATGNPQCADAGKPPKSWNVVGRVRDWHESGAAL